MTPSSSSPAPLPAGGTSRGAAIVGMLITFMGGYLLGALGRGPGGDAWKAAAEAKRIQVPVATSPSNGPDDALVTVVEFADFQCPHCSRSVGLQHRLLAQFPGTVRWVFKHLPLHFHREARGAARASMAADAQGQFWPFHDRLFSDVDHQTRSDLLRLASDLGLDMGRFRGELDGSAVDRLVDQDMQLASKLGVRGTPTFFINGREVVGPTYDTLEAMVRQELAWSAELLRRGVPRAQIYEELTKPAAAPAAPASQPAQPAAASAARREPPVR
jgi:protein-disulfide isomerase